MEQSFFRKKSLERISSPDQMEEYLRVTNPSVWMMLLAAVVLVVGMIVWGAFASFESSASGTAKVENGKMTIYFDDSAEAKNLKTGMKVSVGETEVAINSMGKSDDGRTIAVADTELADGWYPATVPYKRTRVISLLLN